MKRAPIIYFLLVFTLISCSSSRNINKKTQNDEHNEYRLGLDKNDYSKSALEAIQLIKTETSNVNFNSLSVEIINIHNGRYSQLFTISKPNSRFEINTETTNSSGKKKVKKTIYEEAEFQNILDNLIKNSENQIVIAGAYQIIILKTKNTEQRFNTRKAFGLLDVL